MSGVWGLTTRQKRILNYLVSYADREGFPPSFREIMDAVGLVSASSVHHQIRTLDALGLIRVVPGQARAIDVRPARDAGYGAKRREAA